MWPWVIVTVWLFLIWPVSSFNLWPFIECFSIISLFFCRYDYFWFINNNLLLGFIIYISFLMLKILNVVVIRWFELLIGSYRSILGNIQEARHKTLKFPRKQNRRISTKSSSKTKPRNFPWNFHKKVPAFTKSLASEQSRDITFAALVPWFQIQTLTHTLTLTNTPNHTITLTRFQTLTQPRNEAFCPV